MTQTPFCIGSLGSTADDSRPYGRTTATASKSGTPRVFWYDDSTERRLGTRHGPKKTNWNDEYDRRYDTVIEVLDVATGRVVISQRFDAYVAQFTSDGLLYDIREAPSLLLRADVWRPEVVKQP